MITRVKTMIFEQLSQGTTAHALARATAFGIVIGNFPLLGTTTPLCFLVGYTGHLNQPILQIVNYIMYPSQVLMLPVFTYAGECLTGAAHQSFNPHDLVKEFAGDKGLFLKHFGAAAGHAVLAWALCAPFVWFAVYFLSKMIYVRLARARAARK